MCRCVFVCVLKVSVTHCAPAPWHLGTSTMYKPLHRRGPGVMCISSAPKRYGVYCKCGGGASAFFQGKTDEKYLVRDFLFSIKDVPRLSRFSQPNFLSWQQFKRYRPAPKYRRHHQSKALSKLVTKLQYLGQLNEILEL